MSIFAKIIILLVFPIILYTFYLSPVNIVFGAMSVPPGSTGDPGTTDCQDLGRDATGAPLCYNTAITHSCASGYEAPSCQEYAIANSGICPDKIDCVPAKPATPPTGIDISEPKVSACTGLDCPKTGTGTTSSTPILTATGATAGIAPKPKVGIGATSCKFGPDQGVGTAIGCIPTNPVGFIKAVSQLATGVGGGIALLLMISGVFKMMTSAGNPDAVKAGGEQFSSALIGLLFIIFAVLLLKVIGVDILNIPGFIK